MDNSFWLMLLTDIIAVGIGIFVGRKLLNRENGKRTGEAQTRAEEILKTAEIQAESIKKDRMLEAKEKFLKLKTEFEDDANKKRQVLGQNETKIRQREGEINQMQQTAKRRETELDQLKSTLDGQRNSVEQQRVNLNQQLETAKKKQEEAELMLSEQEEQLEKIANLTADQAREQLINSIRAEAESRASSYVKNIVEEAKLTATKEAKKVVIDTIQRTATEHAIENCVSIFNIESDDIKGKVIGREGRNIRALEAATGVEIIVDDTPEAIIISGFDPVRREIARLSLHRLVQDGRIHPARIEEIVAKTRKNI